jgi:peptidase M23-like protein
MVPGRKVAAAALMSMVVGYPAVADARASNQGGVPAPSSGAAGAAGAVQAPSLARSGGSQYGVISAQVPRQRPIVGLLSVPSTALSGRPPRVTLRIDEPGALVVRVRVTVTDLSTRKPVIVVSMGWVRTGRTLSVRWPPAARLAPGSYHVSVSGEDSRSAPLLRRAHSSGVATLLVTAPPPAPPPLTPPSPSSPEAGVPSPAQTAAAGAVFPVAGAHSFGGPDNRFGAPRRGHTHQGQDILSEEGTPILAPFSGLILVASYQAGGAGYYAVEHTGVGFDFMFAHCVAGSLSVAPEQAVAAGQTLCKAGQTGDATAPHLHFEIWVGGWQTAAGYPIDPLPYLQAWDHTGAGG